MTETTRQTLQRARARGVPLIAIETPDTPGTCREIAQLLADENETPPVLTWDIVSGLRAANSEGTDALTLIAPDGGDYLTNPPETLSKLAAAPQGSVIVTCTLEAALAAQDEVSAAATAHALRALRDPYKSQGCTLLLVCATWPAPQALADDVLLVREPLPQRDELARMLTDLHAAASLTPTPEAIAAATDATVGLSLFAAEQAAALSLTREGMDMPALWQRKRDAVNSVPGLSIRDEPGTLSDLAGLDQLKRTLSALAASSTFDAVLWLDEIEKSMAGGFASTSGDSGASKDQLGTLLQWIQDRMNRSALVGMLLLGPPGTGKSAICQAVGNEADRPTVRLDMGALKGQFVGQSEAQIRRALGVVDALCPRRLLLIATANAARSIDSALLSRFAQRWFVDLPAPESMPALWEIYRTRYGIDPDDPTPPSAGWTGREVRTCCEWADLLRQPLATAAETIVPVSVSARTEIEQLRSEADGRYLSADYPGPYRRPETRRPETRQLDI